MSDEICDSAPASRPSEPLIGPMRTKRLADQFKSDLSFVYRSVVSAVPEELLPALAEKFELQRANDAGRRASFIGDLREIFRSQIPQPVPPEKLEELSKRLDEWRCSTATRVTELWAHLPADDPLRCGVSLFGAMAEGRRETAHTRMLAWMLHPAKEHGFGGLLAQKIFSYLKISGAANNVAVQQAEAEYQIDDGRLDIFAQGTFTNEESQPQTWVMVVEAKIDASLGVRQLERYDHWVDQNFPEQHVVRIFLTPAGFRQQSSKDQWTALSFAEIACVLRSASRLLKDAPGYHLLRFYITGLLRDICRWPLPLSGPADGPDVYSCLKYLESVCRSEGVAL